MRHTPDKNTILKLQATGLTQREIARRYGVSDQAISWALHHTPKLKKGYVSFLIPSRVIDHWRNAWGWSDEQIRDACMRYGTSFAKRLDK